MADQKFKDNAYVTLCDKAKNNSKKFILPLAIQGVIWYTIGVGRNKGVPQRVEEKEIENEEHEPQQLHRHLPQP